jgi:proline iminopeptidase
MLLPMRRKLLAAAVLLAALLIVAAALLWRMMSGPLYHPGDVRAGKDLADPLSAPPQAGAWRVAPGIELHHFEEGAGSPLLIVHGGPGFPPPAPWRAGRLLAPHYRLIYYHQRGCGLSTRPVRSLTGRFYQDMMDLHRRLGLPAQISDIERIRRILGRDKLVLVGHSFGALIAALYAAEFPDRVSALVFVAPANVVVLPGPRANLMELVARRLPPALRPEYESYLAEYFDFRRALARSEAESSTFYGRFAKYVVEAYPGAIPAGSDAPSPGYVPTAIYLGLGRRHDYSAALRAVKTPVLVLHGSRDMQDEETSRDFARLFPNSRFRVIANAGHFMYDDQPEQFAAAIEDFLGGTGERLTTESRSGR